MAYRDPTAWLRMQSEAKRSPRGSSLQFAICREIFRNCRESRCIGCQIFQCFQPFKGSSPYLASSEHFSVLQGRAARDCECSRVGFADSTSAVAGAAARRRMEPDARRRNSDICPSRRLRTVSLGIRAVLVHALHGGDCRGNHSTSVAKRHTIRKERTCRWRCGRTKSSDRRQGCAPGLPAVTKSLAPRRSDQLPTSRRSAA
jgi:hypothetical protein